MTTSPTALNWVSIFVLGLIWGGTFMVVSMALEGYGPITVATARTTLGAVALVMLAGVMRKPLPLRDIGLWRYIIPIGIFSTALPFFLLSWGQQHVASAFAGLSMAALPLFLLPLAHVFSDEKMSTRRTIGVLVGFVGAVVLLGPGAYSGGSGNLDLLARLACLGAVLSYAVSSITTRQCPPVDPTALSALSLLVGSLFMLPIMLALEGVPHWQAGRSGYAIVFLGLVPTALATLLRIQTIRSAGSVFLSLVNYQVPLWAVVFGVAVLNETLPISFFLALALILTGLVISQFGALRRLFAET